MNMPNRKYTVNNSYRYGFNGKENDKDAGEGVQDYGFRIYDSRIGKFLSVDPIFASYPYYTPYQFAGNMPIAAIDLDGLEQYVVIYYKDIKGETTEIQVRAIFDNNGEVLNQHVHKVGETKDIAEGNVLVFESYQQKNGYENMKLVKKRNTPDSKLTAQELKIFKKKKPESEKGETQHLGYGGNPKGEPSQYVSQEFKNSDTKTYSATFGIATPEEKPKTPDAVTKKKNEKTVVEVEVFTVESEGANKSGTGNDMHPIKWAEWMINAFNKEFKKQYKADTIIIRPNVHYNHKFPEANIQDQIKPVKTYKVPTN